MANGAEAHTMPNATYGFIGLGNMGSGMAKNLRATMPEPSMLVVCELDEKRRNDFISSTKGLIEIADTPREVVEKCVSSTSACQDASDSLKLKLNVNDYRTSSSRVCHMVLL